MTSLVKLPHRCECNDIKVTLKLGYFPIKIGKFSMWTIPKSRGKKIGRVQLSSALSVSEFIHVDDYHTCWINIGQGGRGGPNPFCWWRKGGARSFSVGGFIDAGSLGECTWEQDFSEAWGERWREARAREWGGTAYRDFLLRSNFLGQDVYRIYQSTTKICLYVPMVNIIFFSLPGGSS